MSLSLYESNFFPFDPGGASSIQVTEIHKLNSLDLRTNPFQEGGNDVRALDQVEPRDGAKEHVREMDSITLPSGPITRLRAKKFKEALQGLVQEYIEDGFTKVQPDINKMLMLLQADYGVLDQ